MGKILILISHFTHKSTAPTAGTIATDVKYVLIYLHVCAHALHCIVLYFPLLAIMHEFKLFQIQFACV